MGVIGSGRGFVDRADVCTLCIEGRIGLRGQPVADAMRLEVSLFFKGLREIEWAIFGLEA
jgi:hypothetical protein